MKDETMVIGVDCRMLFSSGIGRYLREILWQFKPTESASLILYCNDSSQVEWVHFRLPTAKIIKRSNRVYGLVEQIDRAWAFRACDVVWVPHYNFIALSCVMQIVTVHDIAHLALPEVFGVRSWYSRIMFRLILISCMPVIFVSDFTEKEFGRLVGCVPLYSKVIRSGVDHRDYFLKMSEPREEFYLYIGNLKPHKNLLRLLLACKDFTSRRLVVVGKSSGFITGFTPLELNAMNSNVDYLGEVDDLTLADLYSRAAALIFPSLYEGFGFPPLEAMVSGCPVIASNIETINEICGQGFNKIELSGNLIYFDPYDVESIKAGVSKFEKLSRQELNAMKSNAKKHAATYQWSAAADLTWSFIMKSVSPVKIL